MPRHYNPKLARVRQLKTSSHNLENILGLAAAGTQTEMILDQIAQAFAHQFKLEKQVIESFGLELTTEHIDEHRKILVDIKQLEREWRSNQISGITFAETLKAMYYYHVSLFDTSAQESLSTEM